MILIRSPFQISISWRGSHFIWHLVNNSSNKATNIILLFLDGRDLPVKWYSVIWYNFKYLMIPFHEKHTAKGSSCNCKTSFEKLFVPFSSVRFFAHLLERRITQINNWTFRAEFFQNSKKLLAAPHTYICGMWMTRHD